MDPMADSRHHVFEVIRERGPVSLREIQEVTGLSRATVTEVLGQLRARGGVESDTGRSEVRSGTGRPPNLYSVNRDLAAVVGIQFEHASVRAGLADLGLGLAERRTRAIPVSGDLPTALDVAAGMVEEMIAAADVPRDRVLGAAIALPAPVDRTRGTVLATTILPSWEGRRPAAELEQRLQIPVDLDNDGALAGYGEVMAGAAQGCRHAVYVKASAGIGCGIVIDGRIYHGAYGSAGELAHVVIAPEGAPCFCGQRGCLLTVAGGQAIVDALEAAPIMYADRQRESHEADLDQRLRKIVEWARGGDLTCQRVLHDAVGHIAAALVNVCTLLNPERIVFGGTLSLAGEAYFERLREVVTRDTRALSPQSVTIVPPALGEWAEVVGAMALVLRGSRTDLRRRLHALID